MIMAMNATTMGAATGLLRRAGGRPKPESQGPRDLEVVDPSLVKRQPFPPRRPEADLLADDVEDRQVASRLLILPHNLLRLLLHRPRRRFPLQMNRLRRKRKIHLQLRRQPLGCGACLRTISSSGSYPVVT